MVRAVFLDALGTLVELEPPWKHLTSALGDAVPEQQVEDAFLVEMSYYRDHHEEGYDAASLADLRVRSAEVLSAELGHAVDVATMMDAIRFRAYPDAAPALAELRDRGVHLHCVSNWDCSLPEVLERVELLEHLHGVAVSALDGASKPDPAIFAGPLEAAGCGPQEALHVGDSAEDVDGAAAAGIASLLLDRDGEGQIASLTEIVEHLRR
jgi:putative hydrolase of the HAD superfamily